MNDDRRARVLRAIVEDYVATNEPVGSRALVERHRLGVSPATIRNDMAALEQEGLIAQPHTSAGRIPTDEGYRAFVDRIDEVKPLSAAERRAIARVLEAPLDVDDMLERTVRLLSQLTHQVALVQYPRMSRDRVRHLELVDLAAHRLLAVLITETGQVEQRLVDVSAELSEAELLSIRDSLTAALRGVAVADIDAVLAGLAVCPEHRQPVEEIAAALRSLAHAFSHERLLMAGAANLARSAGFGEHIAPLLEAFEEQVVLLKLLGEMVADDSGMSVRIGRENALDSFASTSVVAANYSSDGGEARMAVLGPTRMDYPTTMSALRAVAKYVSVILSE